MILIFSNDYDITTNDVIDWLLPLKKNFLMVRDSKKFAITFELKKIIIHYDRDIFDFDEVKSVWFRRGYIKPFNKIDTKDLLLNKILEKHNNTYNEYFNFLLNKKNIINTYYNSEPNKLIVKDIANEIGFRTPLSFFIDNKEDLKKILVKYKLITKNISGSSVFEFADRMGIIYTNLIDEKTIEELPDEFSNSYIEEYIEKRYELRIFYLNKSIWTAAIISQNDVKTKIDYRNYNTAKPNKIVPFNLPKDIKIKTIKLMNKLKINCGSIDMIVDNNLNYYFLEVNPIGQFGDISYYCNFNLEKNIAENL